MVSFFVVAVIIISLVITVLIWAAYFSKRAGRTGNIVCAENVQIVDNTSARHYINMNDVSGLVGLIRYGMDGKEYSLQLLFPDGSIMSMQTNEEVYGKIAKNMIGTAYYDGKYLLRFDVE